MQYEKKLKKVLEAVDSKTVPFPKSLKKKRINYLPIINAVALIRSIRKKDKEGCVLLLMNEVPVINLLDTHSSKECSYFIASLPEN